MPLRYLRVGGKWVEPRRYARTGGIWTHRISEAVPPRAAEFDFKKGADTQVLYDKSTTANNFSLGATAGAVDANDPIWTSQGMYFSTDWASGTSTPYLSHEITMLVLMATPLQAGMVFTVADHFNTKLNAGGGLVLEYKRADATFFGQTALTYPANSFFVFSVRKSLVSGIRIGMNKTFGGTASEMSLFGYNAGVARFGAHVNNSVPLVGAAIAGFSWYNRALSDSEFNFAYDYLLAKALANHGVSLGATTISTTPI